MNFIKTTQKEEKTPENERFSGEKYLTQWDNEAKNSEKTKVFKAL
mgnify:CR=1 FL=1